MKTYYNLDVKNPYLSKGKFLWKKNDDSTLGKPYSAKELREERKRQLEIDYGSEKKAIKFARKRDSFKAAPEDMKGIRYTGGED